MINNTLNHILWVACGCYFILQCCFRCNLVAAQLLGTQQMQDAGRSKHQRQLNGFCLFRWFRSGDTRRACTEDLEHALSVPCCLDALHRATTTTRAVWILDIELNLYKGYYRIGLCGIFIVVSKFNFMHVVQATCFIIHCCGRLLTETNTNY